MGSGRRRGLAGDGPTSQPSPLGRYDDSNGAEVGRTLEVRLLNAPVQVLIAARRHHDEVMHEFSLLAVNEASPRAVPRRLADLVETLGRRYGASARRPDAEVDAALDRGAVTVDLTYQVPAHVVEAADRLEALMTEADEFCRREQMLTLPRSALLVDFAHWYLDEFRRQIAGFPPAPWTGPSAP